MVAVVTQKKQGHLASRDGEYKMWAQVRLVRSNHDMWTLEVCMVDTNTSGPYVLTEHILVSPSQIDNFTSIGMPVKNPIPTPPPRKGK